MPRVTSKNPRMKPSKNVIEPLHSFILFPRLPPELRLKIWSHALDHPRIVLVTVANIVGCETIDGCDCYRRVTEPQLPPLLLACQESRFVALKKYELCFQNPISPRPHYFNFESDILFLRGLSRCYNGNKISASIHNIAAIDKVQVLAVIAGQVSMNLLAPEPSYSKLGKSIEKLILVTNAPPRGKGNLNFVKERQGKQRSSKYDYMCEVICDHFDRFSVKYPGWTRPIIEVVRAERENTGAVSR